MSKSTNKIIGAGAVIIGALALNKFLQQRQQKSKEFQIYQADLSSALSAHQTITRQGQKQLLPYVQSTKSTITGEPYVKIQKEALMPNNPSQKGIAVSGLSLAEWAALNRNDRRALEKGQFKVVDEGILIRPIDRLISLLPKSWLEAIG